MGPGKGFGEIALILETNRTASIRAKSYVDVYFLRDKDLAKTMGFFPELVSKLEKVAEERLAKIRERDINVKLSKRNLTANDNSISTPFFTPRGSYVNVTNIQTTISNNNFLKVGSRFEDENKSQYVSAESGQLVDNSISQIQSDIDSKPALKMDNGSELFKLSEDKPQPKKTGFLDIPK